MLKRVNIGVAKRVVLSPRSTGFAHPCGEELTRKARGTQAGKFAKQIELAFSDEVERIRYREMITDVRDRLASGGQTNFFSRINRKGAHVH
jgi:hypothetical protein